ncbi:uncharacterized protein C34C12.4 [Tribolium castaneum]|uniref:Small integral membrane protein 14 n=1 Tax=Tribolium castaneum TaxID=7070 RepID=D6X1I9_TRICA|nr:PREDICTED: uncharacterized protein C34C12.4 [Tribolium castaneum]EFA09413.1 Small integral membrane protein 14-like Protein [Tribolium castaneum]|eukprot:XP_967287.2 PREDICTED: uncharacterized protein C34C12.4 [Tribolium castaneum]
MSDENMDLCECIWGHELAMRRLLNVIRNSQSNCVDNECFDEGFQRQSPESSMLLMTCVLMVAMFLYYFRPRTQRIDDTKPGRSDRNGAPPSPPAPMS